MVPKYNQKTRFADYLFSDINGQQLIGVYELSLKSVILKPKRDFRENEIFSLRSDIIASVVKNHDGSVVGEHSPIQYFELSLAGRGASVLKVFDSKESFTFADRSIVQFYIADLKEKEVVDIEFCVHFTYRRKTCNG